MKTILLYIGTTAVAVSIGLILVNLLEPGSAIPDSYQETLSNEYIEKAADKKNAANSVQKNRGPLQPLVDMVPSNIFSAASNNSNMLQVVFISIIFGISLLELIENFQNLFWIFLKELIN